MLPKEDQQQIRHLCEALEKEITTKKEEMDELSTIKSRLFKYLWDLNVFECPNGLSNYDAICPKCSIMLPEVTTGRVRDKGTSYLYRFPYGTEQKLIDEAKQKVSGCQEWGKKQIQAVCGCGGIMWCECGYNEEYCWSDREKCPYCDRSLQHRLYKSLTADFSEIIMNVAKRKEKEKIK